MSSLSDKIAQAVADDPNLSADVDAVSALLDQLAADVDALRTDVQGIVDAAGTVAADVVDRVHTTVDHIASSRDELAAILRPPSA